MSEPTAAEQLALAKAETRALIEQLRQTRAELHRLGIADQNRALLCGAVAGGVGLLVGLGVGLRMRK